MMKALRTILLIILIICIGWVAWLVAYGADGGQTTHVLLTKKSLGKTLPKCYGADCQGKLTKLVVHVHQPGLAYGDAYLWFNGQTYHSHVWRKDVDSTWYAWIFQGHDIWHKAIKWFAGQHASDVIGPGTLKDIDSLAVANCQAVANAVLVPTGTDAGTIIQPSPTWADVCPETGIPDSGQCTRIGVPQTWSNEQLVTCGGTGYWLARNKYGGTWGTSPEPGEIPSKTDAGQPPIEQVDPNAWNTPDAMTTKTCPNVPIGIECP